MPTKKRLRAVVAGFSYPHPTDLAIIERVGGRGNLTDEQRAKLKEREIFPKPGDWCDDVPEVSRAWLLEGEPIQAPNGYIEEVEVEDFPRRGSSRKTGAGATGAAGERKR